MDEIKEIAALLDERGIKYDLHDYGNLVCYDMDYCESCDDYLCGIAVVGGCVSVEKSYLTPGEAVDTAVGPLITEDTSDGWHSFKDLYHHRALLFSVIVHNYRDLAWKSKRHHDGKELDWNFIVGIDTPWGQASYHYGMEYWDLFDCKEVEQAPYYDGYTADESVARIARLVELDTTKGGCELEISTDMEYVRCDRCYYRMPKGIDLMSVKYCPGCGRQVI